MKSLTNEAEFFVFCRDLSKIAEDADTINSKGGNCSIKFDLDNEIIISCSGSRIFQIGTSLFDSSCCHCHRWFMANATIRNEEEYFQAAKDIRISQDLLPSMEYGLHMVLPYKYVVHLHPTQLNTILCSKESFGTIQRLFDGVQYDFLGYHPPGFQLFQRIKQLVNPRKIIFLQNHGVICCGNTKEEVFEQIRIVNDRVAKFFNCVLFPDAAILPEKNQKVSTKMLTSMRNFGLTPLPLSTEAVEYLQNLPYEKYRKGV